MDALTAISTTMEKWTNPESKDYFLLNSSIQAPVLLIAYLLFSKWIGPAFMRNRNPYNVAPLIRAYNLIQMVSCLMLAVVSMYLTLETRTNILCDFPESSSDYVYRQSARMHWFYFLLKVLDLMDTVFFILRKKNNHVTFLHVYHHACMYLMAWGIAKFIPGPTTCLIGVLNSTVHTFVYFYYFLATFGPKYSKFLQQWKIYLTRMQIVQFVIIAIQGVIILRSGCTSSKIIPALFVIQGVVFICLFTKFYARTYIAKRPVSERKSE